MFFNTPTRSLRRMPRAPASSFSLEVFRVADFAAQQSVLITLRRYRRQGVRALGTQRQSETFVVVDCSTNDDSATARRVVRALDPQATITYSSGNHDHLEVVS